MHFNCREREIPKGIRGREEEKQLIDVLQNAAEKRGCLSRAEDDERVRRKRLRDGEKRDEKDADMMNAGRMDLSVSGWLA